MISLNKLSYFKKTSIGYVGNIIGTRWDELPTQPYLRSFSQVDYVSVDRYIGDVNIRINSMVYVNNAGYKNRMGIAVYFLENGIVKYQHAYVCTHQLICSAPYASNCNGMALSIEFTGDYPNAITDATMASWDLRYEITQRDYQKPIGGGGSGGGTDTSPVIPGLEKCDLYMKKGGILIPCKPGIKLST